MELYRTHRPTKLSDVVGQDNAVAMIESWFTVSRRKHTVIFAGPSGCGKTTLARIFCDRLKCHPDDVYDVNGADFRGIDTVRDIRQKMHLSPLIAGGARAWILDEAHKMTSDAQTALLKILEDGCPSWVYFILCTTEMDRLIATIKTRAAVIQVKSLGSKDLLTVMQRVMKEAKINNLGSDALLYKIADAANGSARKAIQLLDQVSTLESSKEREAFIDGMDSKQNAFQVVRCLLWEKADWKKVAQVIEGLDDNEEWEGLRRLVLNMAAKECLKGGKTAARAYLVLCCFEEPWFYTGKAGLVRACYEALHRD